MRPSVQETALTNPNLVWLEQFRGYTRGWELVKKENEIKWFETDFLHLVFYKNI